MAVQQSWIIGSARECDLVVENPTVSRRHAQLTREDGQYWLEDLVSSNGTFVNGERVSSKVAVSAKDCITLGKNVVFAWPERAPLIERLVAIGRAADNDVVLDLPNISAYHARIIVGGKEGATIEDLGSTNGTFLGPPKRRVIRAPLSSADVIYFGSHEIAASDLLLRANVVLPPAEPPPADSVNPPAAAQALQANSVFQSDSASAFLPPAQSGQSGDNGGAPMGLSSFFEAVAAGSMPGGVAGGSASVEPGSSVEPDPSVAPLPGSPPLGQSSAASSGFSSFVEGPSEPPPAACEPRRGSRRRQLSPLVNIVMMATSIPVALIVALLVLRLIRQPGQPVNPIEQFVWGLIGQKVVEEPISATPQRTKAEAEVTPAASAAPASPAAAPPTTGLNVPPRAENTPSPQLHPQPVRAAANVAELSSDGPVPSASANGPLPPTGPAASDDPSQEPASAAAESSSRPTAKQSLLDAAAIETTSDDRVEAALASARQTYQAKQQKYEADVAKYFEKRLESARKTGGDAALARI
ncbi:MAG TPA: FHA domain-containing protein, partial [Pirellulales bacterium]|nr:FHA domain-containing protein [Pirellulales bacterium]